MDTLDCAFAGRKDLFEGLYLGSAESGWDWTRKSVVLRIDFAGGSIREADGLDARLHRILDAWESEYSLSASVGPPGDRLMSLVPAIAKLSGTEVRWIRFAIVAIP